MRKWKNRLHLVVLPEFYVCLALVFLVIPVKWVLAWLLASAFHELCHYLALKLSGCGVLRIQIGFNGTIMETDLISWGREIFCALAGPLGGFALLLAAKWFPRTAICGCFQSLYNLLPIFPLDGGRAVYSLLRSRLTEIQAERVSGIITNCILLALGLLCAYAAFALSLGPVPLIFAGILILKSKKIKRPCKEGALRVQ